MGGVREVLSHASTPPKALVHRPAAAYCRSNCLAVMLLVLNFPSAEPKAPAKSCPVAGFRVFRPPPMCDPTHATLAGCLPPRECAPKSQDLPASNNGNGPSKQARECHSLIGNPPIDCHEGDAIELPDAAGKIKGRV